MTLTSRTGVRALALVATVAAIVVSPLAAGAGAVKPTVYSVRTGGAVTLADAGGAPTTIASLLLPRGSWTVTSNVTAVDFGTGDFVRCTLQDAGTIFDGGATTYVDGTAAGITNSSVLKTTAAATTVALVCTHDQNAPTPSQFFLDPGATLTAVAGGPIKGAAAAEPAAGPGVVQVRTTTQTPVAQDAPTTVEQVRVAAGTWAFHANLSFVNFSGFDFANCELFTATDLIAQSQVVVGNADVVVSNVSVQGARTFTKTTTVKLACDTTYTTGVYIDPGATLIAARVAPADVVSGFDTKGILPDTGGTQLTVFRQAMPAGAWRVSSAQTTDVSDSHGGIGGATDYVRCGLYAGSTPIDGGATARIVSFADGGNGNYEQMIVDGGTHTATKAWTLSVRCWHDTTISGDSHWTVKSFSPVVAIQQGPIESSVI